MSLFRGFSNSYFFLKQTMYDFNRRNLGYFSSQQTSIAIYFKSVVIDWISGNEKDIDKHVVKKTDEQNISKYINKLRNEDFSTNGILELYALNCIYYIPILVWVNDEILYIFKDKSFIDSSDIIKEEKDKLDKKLCINLQFILKDNSDIPNEIYCLYFI